MAKPCKNTNPLRRDGTSQIGRILEELKPGFAKIMDWDHKDWCKFVYQFSSLVQFYKKDNDLIPDGNWANFYEKLSTGQGIDDLLASLKTSDEHQPHVALLMAFIHLLDLVKNHINELTGQHLDFYYKSVLRLTTRDFQPDKAHIIFEAIKNAGNVKVEKDSVVKAIKDAEGNQLYYKTTGELIVNEVQIGGLKSIFHNNGSQADYKKGLFYANESNTEDGLGVKLAEGVAWSAMASSNWPKAAIGFAFASPILNLKEGERRIFFHLKLKSSTLSLTDDEFGQSLQILFTGEKGWLGPYFPASLSTTVLDGQKVLNIEILVPASEKAIVTLDKKVITEPINSVHPVARFIFNVNGAEQQGEKATELIEKLQGIELESLEIGVDVRGMKENQLENDYGPLEPSKPFMPFGPQPNKGNNLFIGSTEVFEKNWKNLTIDINWKDLPLNSEGDLDFFEHYIAYRKRFLKQNSKEKYDISLDKYTGEITPSAENDVEVEDNLYFKSDIYILNEKNWQKASTNTIFSPLGTDTVSGAFKTLYSIENTAAGEGCNAMPPLPVIEEAEPESGNIQMDYVKGFNHGYAQTYNESVVYNFLAGNTNLFYDSGAFEFGGKKVTKELENYGASAKKGFIKITLKSSFFHKIYPVLYAMAMVENSNPALLLPNEPYTPFIESLTIGYQACTSETFILDVPVKQFSNFAEKKVQLFHEGPFGFAQQHNFLKNSLSFLSTENHRKIYLEPFYPYAGEFFIGLQHAIPQQTVSLLLQFASGSEDPTTSLSDDQKPRFWILSSDEWRPLDSSHILGNTTNGFLQPGLIQFVVPKEATLNNTRLPSGLIWLRVTIPLDTNPNALCKVLNIYTQALVAQLDNRNNNLDHLNSSLPAESISKMLDRPSGIKSLSQPFNSFDGKPEERKDSFYRRVSERLRHKQRAVSIWDFEALALQYFPEIHKVKCLNHTHVLSESAPIEINELAPGYVTLVVIPNLNNKNAFDPLKPRVSRNVIEKIEDFLIPLCSKQVVIDVINPFYEEVTLKFNVLFFSGYDPDFYKNQLNTDLIAYLSPWMNVDNKEIHFGTYLYESMVIHFIDSLYYVDLITDFSMRHTFVEQGIQKSEKEKKICPSNSAAILVSSSNHDIVVLDKAQICANG